MVTLQAPGRGFRGEPKPPPQKIRQHFYWESGMGLLEGQTLTRRSDNFAWNPAAGPWVETA